MFPERRLAEFGISKQVLEKVYRTCNVQLFISYCIVKDTFIHLILVRKIPFFGIEYCNKKIYRISPVKSSM